MQVSFCIWIKQICSHSVLVHPLKMRFWDCFPTSKPDFVKEHQWCLRRSYLMLFSLLAPLLLSSTPRNWDVVNVNTARRPSKSALISVYAPTKFSQQLETPLQISSFLNPRQQRHSAVTERTLTHILEEEGTSRSCSLCTLNYFGFCSILKQIKASKQRCWVREGIWVLFMLKTN